MVAWLLTLLESGDMPFNIEDIVTIVLDGAAPCLSWFAPIHEKYPHIVCQWCCAHSINLLMQCLGELDGIYQLILEAKEVIKFFRNRGLPRHLIRESAGKIPIMWVVTRFGTTFISMERLGELRSQLAAIVVSTHWAIYVAKQDKDGKAKCAQVRALVLSGNFWAKIDKTMILLEPVFATLRRFDGNDATAGIQFEIMAVLIARLVAWDAIAFDPLPDGRIAFEKSKCSLKGLSTKTVDGKVHPVKQFAKDKSAAEMGSARWDLMSPDGSRRGAFTQAAYAMNPYYLMCVPSLSCIAKFSLYTQCHPHLPFTVFFARTAMGSQLGARIST